MTFRPLAASSILACTLMLPLAATAQEITPQIDGDAQSPALGEPYPVATHQDWEIVCTRMEEDGPELCEMYQLMLGEDDAPIAEINIAALPPEEEFTIGATITTPLGTFLMPGMGWQIGDDGDIRAEPFQVCSAVGCSALLGFSEDEVQAMRMGAHANVMFRPFVNPQAVARARVSLMGFTAALEDLQERAPVPLGATMGE